VLGTGQMGSAIARVVLEKKGMELAGVYARRPERAGLDVGEAIGLGRELGLAVDGDLAALVARTRADIAIQATCSRVAEAVEEIRVLLRAGVDVVSIAEEMAYPAAASPALAAEIDDLAARNGATVLGTGINPGFVLDLLVIALTGVCAQVDSIEAKRVNDLSPYGPSVLSSQGVGLTPEQFREGLEDGSVTGHMGFPETIAMIADAVGWSIERVEESREPIISSVRRSTPFVEVEPGCAAGCLQTAIAYARGKPVIELIHPQQIHPEVEGVATGDFIEIHGTPDVSLSGSPEIPGGVATAALAVNVIPRVLDAAPGLKTMSELPVPAALIGDVRARITGHKGGSAHG